MIPGLGPITAASRHVHRPGPCPSLVLSVTRLTPSDLPAGV